jgi:hypothetical protein
LKILKLRKYILLQFSFNTASGSSSAGVGEINKQRQFNEKIWYREVQDLSFYVMRCFLKILFKQSFLKIIEILKIWLKGA